MVSPDIQSGLIVIIIFTGLSIPLLRYFSNLLTCIGLYHRNEPLHVRLGILYKNYLILSLPIVFSLFELLKNSNLIITDYNQIGTIALISYAIFPISTRVLSLAKKPLPCDISQIDWDGIKGKCKTDVIQALNGIIAIQSAERLAEIWGATTIHTMKRSLLREKKERILSSIFSMIFIGWIVYIIILPAELILYGPDAYSVSNVTIVIAQFFYLIILFFVLPFVYVIIGEVCLHLCGVDDMLKTDRV